MTVWAYVGGTQGAGVAHYANSTNHEQPSPSRFASTMVYYCSILDDKHWSLTATGARVKLQGAQCETCSMHIRTLFCCVFASILLSESRINRKMEISNIFCRVCKRGRTYTIYNGNDLFKQSSVSAPTITVFTSGGVARCWYCAGHVAQAGSWLSRLVSDNSGWRNKFVAMWTALLVQFIKLQSIHQGTSREVSMQEHRWGYSSSSVLV